MRYPTGISRLPVRQFDPQPGQTQRASCPHRARVATYAYPDVAAQLHGAPVAPTPQVHEDPWPPAPVTHAAPTLTQVTVGKLIAGLPPSAEARGLDRRTGPLSRCLPTLLEALEGEVQVQVQVQVGMGNGTVV